MTPAQASARALTFCASLFLILAAFHYGRLTASTVTLRSACDIEASDRQDLKAGWYKS